ncbi:MAG: hypothetical protein H0T89_29485 [Deltaproteobacteria bacterium]|nr:hypothetical protein [Deltaproteobacteria bacterium]MDQ3300056.1 hypothetical protein [Myxococcota bacterium]
MPAPPPEARGPDAPKASGRLVVNLGDDATTHGLDLPFQVRGTEGSISIKTPGRQVLALPAHPTELIPLLVDHAGVVWFRIASGADVKLTDHPCCFLEYESNKYDDAIATCARAGASLCPEPLDTVQPGLGDDKVCGRRRRCVRYPEVRLVARGAADDGPYTQAKTDLSNLYRLPETFAGKALAPVAIAVDRAYRYTVWIENGQVIRVRRDGRVAPTPA